MDRRYSLAAIAMVAALAVCAGALATADVSDADASGTCGDHLTWTYTTSDNTLAISGYGDMDFQGSFVAPWWSFCGKMQKVVLPDGLTSIEDRAFNSCFGLKSVTIPSSVTYIGIEAFCSCMTMTQIDVDDGNAEYSSLDGILYDKEKTELIQCPGGTVLTSVTVPDTVISIDSYAFDSCSSLTSVTIPSSVVSVGDHAFEFCTSLTSVTIPSSVVSVGDHAFEFCTSLTSVTIPSSVTSIGTEVFICCSSLTGIFVDGGNTVYSSSDGVLYDKAETELIQFPGGIDWGSVTIPSSVTSIGKYAFEYCLSLTSVDIPSSVTSVGLDAFSECSSLTSVTIPPSLTYVSDSMFWNCSSLTSVTMPSSLTSIGTLAFYKCLSLTSITIPLSVTYIGDEAFSGSSVKTVYNESGLDIKAGDYGLSDSAVIISYNCVVSFDANGGVLSGDAQSTARYGQAFDIPQTASRDGYTFSGWYTAADGGDRVVSGDVWDLKENVTLYAHWEESSGISVWVIAAIAIAAIAAVGIVGYVVKSRR